MQYTTQQPLKWKWTGPIDKNGKFHSAWRGYWMDQSHITLSYFTLIGHYLFVLKMLSAFYICCIYKCTLDKIFYGSKQYEPWPREQPDVGPYCLQYRLPKNINRQEEQMTSCKLAH